MKNMQIWIIVLLILSMPVTSIAGITNLHCIDSTDDDQTEVYVDDHCSNSGVNETVKDKSSPDHCFCDCPGSLGCANIGLNAYAITHICKISHLNQIAHYYVLFDKFTSVQSPPLIRPPIYNS